MATITTKTDVRKVIGRGSFTSLDFAEKAEVSRVAARQRLRKLVESGVVEPVTDDEGKPVTERVLTDDGQPSRGRPRQVFRAAKGK